ncbi:MAG: HAMP domain-containing protein [Deltaproteobacteria bacterium]|nr:HAMP domain-containing protein [Deltaproteobacteria bacterium]
MGPRRFGLSILTKIFLGFAAVIASFGGLAAYGEYESQKAVSTLRLVAQDYIATVRAIDELGATQRITMAYLGGLDESKVARDWLKTVRNLRPASLQRARRSVAGIRTRRLPPGERAFFARVESELVRIAAGYASDERRFEELYARLDARDMERAQSARLELERRERDLWQRLKKLRQGLEDHVRELSDRAATDQAQSRWNLLGLTAVALAVALVVWIVVFRTLSPIRRMRETAAAVARGDLDQRLAIRRADELGLLAEEFDRMTEALVARDERLKAQARDLIQAERLATIGKMAAHITHEVRNPLSSIGLNAELLQEEIGRLSSGSDGKEAMALIESIGREIDRLTAITEEYLRFARLPDPRSQPEDLLELARSVVEFVRAELESSGLSVELRVLARPPAVTVDEAQIRQALMNLLRNAREATPAGGAVTVEIDRHEGWAVLSVRDSGPGISPDHAGQIFDAFFTTKEQGTGLGLPLVRQIALAHGGTIECKSDPGRGATFVLELPAADSTGPSDEQARTSHAQGAT